MLEAAQHKPLYLVTRPSAASDTAKKVIGKENVYHDCAALPGQFHVPGCDMKECPGCGGQMIGCECKAEAIDQTQLERWENDEEYEE
jgi:hypothetical protein